MLESGPHRDKPADPWPKQAEEWGCGPGDSPSWQGLGEEGSGSEGS